MIEGGRTRNCSLPIHLVDKFYDITIRYYNIIIII